MLWLGLDTATPVTSIAVSTNGEVLSETAFTGEQTQMERLMPGIDAALKSAGKAIGDIEGIGVGLGPGLFTSSRIGVVTAKTLCFAMGIPLVGVSSLDVLSYGTSASADRVVSVIDARRGEVFAAVYLKQGDTYKELTPADVMPPMALADALSKEQGPFHLTGDGAVRYEDIFKDALQDNVTFEPVEDAYPKASVVLQLAAQRYANGVRDDIASLVPTYVRKPDAEAKFG